MTYLELMETEIRRAGKPLTIRDALNSATEHGTIKELPHIGKTPQNTLSAALHRDIDKGEQSRFMQVSNMPATFDIKYSDS